MKKYLLLGIIAILIISCAKNDPPYLFLELNKSDLIYDQKGGSEILFSKENIKLSLKGDNKEYTDFGYRMDYQDPSLKKIVKLDYYLDGNVVYKIKSDWFVIDIDRNKPKEFRITVLPMSEDKSEKSLIINISSKKNFYKALSVKQKYK